MEGWVDLDDLITFRIPTRSRTGDRLFKSPTPKPLRHQDAISVHNRLVYQSFTSNRLTCFPAWIDTLKGESNRFYSLLLSLWRWVNWFSRNVTTRSRRRWQKLASDSHSYQGCGLGLDGSVLRPSRDVYQHLVSVSGYFVSFAQCIVVVSRTDQLTLVRSLWIVIISFRYHIMSVDAWCRLRSCSFRLQSCNDCSQRPTTACVWCCLTWHIVYTHLIALNTIRRWSSCFVPVRVNNKLKLLPSNDRPCSRMSWQWLSFLSVKKMIQRKVMHRQLKSPFAALSRPRL